ncbi:hypothetical protein AAVH_10777 [Aphelenchoides avenae]|nr:hypothetical protein AAVH_10777 [Aphelenchus avenae]
MLLVSIMIMYSIASVNFLVAYSRNAFLYFTYANPCDLLIPVWMNVVVRGIGYVYVYSFPLWHLALSIERVWATLQPHKYESSGVGYGVLTSVTVWVYSLTYFIYGFGFIYLAFQDDQFRKETPFLTLDTKTNAIFKLISNYLNVGLDVGSVVIDLVTAVVNKRRIKAYANFPGYSLSRAYQLNENVKTTMRLILPLDFCNAFLYVSGMGLATVVRQLKLSGSVSPQRFQSLIELTTAIFWLQPPISLLVFMRFAKSDKRSAVIHDQESEARIYFEHFRKQLQVGHITRR